MSRPIAPRAGVCVVRVESDGSTDMRITVTSRHDVHDAGCETTRRIVTVNDAVLYVLDFLTEFNRGVTGR